MRYFIFFIIIVITAIPGCKQDEIEYVDSYKYFNGVWVGNLKIKNEDAFFIKANYILEFLDNNLVLVRNTYQRANPNPLDTIYSEEKWSFTNWWIDENANLKIIDFRNSAEIAPGTQYIDTSQPPTGDLLCWEVNIIDLQTVRLRNENFSEGSQTVLAYFELVKK